MARSIALLIIGAFYRMIITRNKLILIFENYYKVTSNSYITEFENVLLISNLFKIRIHFPNIETGLNILSVQVAMTFTITLHVILKR